MKFIRIFLLVLIIIGLILLVTQKMWVPKLVNKIIEEENKNISVETGNEIKVTPISHATMVLQVGKVVVYTDPVGGASAFTGQPTPSLVLVTDIHGDHLNVDTLKSVLTDSSTLVVPKAVADKITEDLKGEMVVLNNGETTKKSGIKILAVPMYNYPISSTSPHTKGRGNGYIIEGTDGEKVYISGDTGNIPEMSTFKEIDIAFLSMNLPYTMGVEDAAKATLAMNPKKIIPYHYRGTDGLSDTKKFRDLVNQGNPNIVVDLIDFYPKAE